METLELLCQCISPVQNTELILAEINSPKFDWNPVVYCSGQHLVTPALWFYLKQKDILSMLNLELQEYLELTYELNLSRNQQIKQQLLSLLPDFNAAGIEPLLLKGIASLLDELYELPGIRVLGDIDILIPQDKLVIAKNIMMEYGYTYTPYPDVIDEQKQKHLPPFFHDTQPVRIEIHRNPVLPKYNKWVNCESAWRESSEISLKQGIVRLPTPEFRLLHNFCHCQLDDKGYSQGYINARQLLEWVVLRDKYDAKLDWLSVQKRVGQNYSTASWGGYLLAAKKYFSQEMIPKTEMPLLTHFFMYRQELGRRCSLCWNITLILSQVFLSTKNGLSVLYLNFKRGPRAFIKAIKFAFVRVFSISWFKKKYKALGLS